MPRLVSVRYQAGSLLFPRARRRAGAAARRADVPLLAPGTEFSEPATENAALAVLRREGQTLSDLAVPGTPEIHFDPEERPILVFPGRLAVAEAKRDELNRGRLRVNVAFTLPPGAYATLVVKRLFHCSRRGRGPLPPAGRSRKTPRPRRPRPSPRTAPRRAAPARAGRRTRRRRPVRAAKQGFLARRRAEGGAQGAAGGAKKRGHERRPTASRDGGRPTPRPAPPSARSCGLLCGRARHRPRAARRPRRASGVSPRECSPAGGRSRKACTFRSDSAAPGSSARRSVRCPPFSTTSSSRGASSPAPPSAWTTSSRRCRRRRTGSSTRYRLAPSGSAQIQSSGGPASPSARSSGTRI